MTGTLSSRICRHRCITPFFPSTEVVVSKKEKLHSSFHKRIVLAKPIRITIKMVYDIFGGKDLNIQIPEDVFPTKEELDLMGQKLPGGDHGWFDSSYQKKRLHYHCFVPKGEVKGIVMFCHGVSTNCIKGQSSKERNCLKPSSWIPFFRKELHFMPLII